MSDHAPMTPAEARECLDQLDQQFPPGDFPAIRRAFHTIANMTEEVNYRIVNPDTNGGKYELRRHTRHVTEWKPQ